MEPSHVRNFIIGNWLPEIIIKIMVAKELNNIILSHRVSSEELLYGCPVFCPTGSERRGIGKASQLLEDSSRETEGGRSSCQVSQSGVQCSHRGYYTGIRITSSV